MRDRIIIGRLSPMYKMGITVSTVAFGKIALNKNAKALATPVMPPATIFVGLTKVYILSAMSNDATNTAKYSFIHCQRLFLLCNLHLEIFLL